MRNPKKVTLAAILCAALSCGQDPSGNSSSGPSSSDLRGASSKQRGPTVTPQNSGLPPTKRIFGISPVNERIVWATATSPSGDGIWLRTLDGGAHWQNGVVRGAETVQLRDVEGVSEKVAYVMSAGSGTDSRIYRTEDGGQTWALTLTNQDPNGFFDCFAFWNPQRGILMDDSVEGKFPTRRTRDGARSWEDLRDRTPPASPNEGAFAASGTCAATQGEKLGWMVTGGGTAPHARVLATPDGGNTWTAYQTPFPMSGSAGLTTIAFRTARRGITAGGDLAQPAEAVQPNVARSSDGGKHWKFTARRTPFPGAAFGLAYVSGKSAQDGEHEGDDEEDRGGFARTVVVTGPGGTAWTSDEGDTWTPLPIDAPNYWAVAFASHRAGWLVGSRARILKITF